MQKTALQIAAELKTGVLSHGLYIEETQSRIRADGHNAFLFTSQPPAAAYQPVSPLSGVAVALADNILVRGELSTAGSLMLNNFIPPYGATVVDKLAAAGLTHVGKTNLGEFGMGIAGNDAHFGPTLHPADTSKVTDGAVATVALGLTPLALCVDSNGNARKQAAFAGVTCLKPTYGTVSRFGLVPYIEATEVVSVLAGNMADAASLYNIIAGNDAKDGTTLPPESYTLNLENSVLTGLKIALPQEYFADLDAEVQAAIDGFCAKLQKLGAHVSKVELPLANYAHLALQAMAAAEGANNISRYDGLKYGYQSEQNRTLEEIYFNSRSEAFQAEAKRTAILGAHLLSHGHYEQYYLKALQIRRLVQQAMQSLFGEYDLVLTPVAQGTAYELRDCADYYAKNWRDSFYTAIPSIIGLPAAVLPLGLNCQGLPVGVQLMADALQEQKLVQAALACGL